MNPLVNAILGVSFIGAGSTATILMYYSRVPRWPPNRP